MEFRLTLYFVDLSCPLAVEPVSICPTTSLLVRVRTATRLAFRSSLLKLRLGTGL